MNVSKLVVVNSMERNKHKVFSINGVSESTKTKLRTLSVLLGIPQAKLFTIAIDDLFEKMKDHEIKRDLSPHERRKIKNMADRMSEFLDGL